MAQPPAVIPAIFGATKNSRVRTSMAFGSDLESGWSGSASNPSGATGWYQILLPVHPGVTAQEAQDPVWSTNYMLPAYTAAVANVPDNLWHKDPELAAEQAVMTAEQPGGPFPQSAVGPYGGEGVAVVNQDWQNVADTLKGKWKPGNNIALPASTDSKNNPPPSISIWQALGEAALGNPSGIAQYAAEKLVGGNTGILGPVYDFLTNPTDAFERLGLIIFGGIIVIVGLVVLAQGSKTVKSAEGAVIGGATRGTSSRISGMVSGSAQERANRREDQQRRLGIAEKANDLGERKLQLKESRERRLTAAANKHSPAKGKHAAPAGATP